LSIEQTVYCKVVGEGEPLVLLHGWGVNSAVWQPVIEKLSQHFSLYVVDLPGFGQSHPLPDYSLKSISDAIMKVVPDSAVWCGWSLGGLIATYTAMNYPLRVNKLIQVACSVKFVADATWPGVNKSIFDDFLLGLQNNPKKTLTRFIALQAMGCTSSRQDIASFKKLLAGTRIADQSALVSGLKLLADSDLRLPFSHFSHPCLSLFGKFDSLVPEQTARDMQEIARSTQSQLFENSAHAPFISESELFCQRIIKFICG